MLPLNTNIREAYARGQDAEQNFIQNLAMFLCTYLKEHGSLVEQRHLDEGLLKALHYLVLISEVEEVEIFKICLEYWNSLSADLYRESPFPSQTSAIFLKLTSSLPPRRQFYSPVLTKVSFADVDSIHFNHLLEVKLNYTLWRAVLYGSNFVTLCCTEYLPLVICTYLHKTYCDYFFMSLSHCTGEVHHDQPHGQARRGSCGGK